jgi:hypothetical protein
MKSLTRAQRQLLLAIVEARCPAYLHIVQDGVEAELPLDRRNEIRDALGHELLDTGLTRNDQLTPRGLLIEDLIDYLGP